jgi:hypothetical protein
LVRPLAQPRLHGVLFLSASQFVASLMRKQTHRGFSKESIDSQD